ncbi:unnamed protein product [Owenia fusiformis]|uniref:Uncharacterized protein n=1 Tax=Owenia fusiformis TaxID=6347 RepID=A0A8J1TW86_OWEFU|nr:unnamed protein product [Owenia fusiformis]
MSLAGLKKQFNKANQFMSEKIGGAKGTELDDEFIEMERKIDVTGKLVQDLSDKTSEFLQPNPGHRCITFGASRAKMMTVNTLAKIRGQSKNATYPQPEGNLGDCMSKYGRELGDDSSFGVCLAEAGESYKQLADVKYSLEDNVKQNFLDPLHYLQTKELKEVNHHRKKLEGRRLDYDCKKRRQVKGGGSGASITEDEIRMAEEKFEDSKQLAETAMFNLLQNDVEQVSQLTSFVESQLDYHRQASEILQTLLETLQEKGNEAASRPKREHIPRRATSNASSYKGDNGSISSPYDNNSNGVTEAAVFKPQYESAEKFPCCKALYDFEPENEGELGFKENDVIKLTQRIDENWFEGSINGKSGFFPCNYVEVVVDV